MNPGSPLWIVSLAVIVSGGATIAAHYLRPPRPLLIYVFKPLTTILILVAAMLPGSFRGDQYAAAICIGLVFSLIGDIWLMLPGDRFVYGLGSFLVAHLCYIYAFLPGAHSHPWLALPLPIIGVIILAYLWPGLPRRMKGPVLVYVVVIVTMASLAVAGATARFSVARRWAAVGALLFLASDAVLAIDRFRRPFHLARAVVLTTYFAGQLMIALSVALPGRWDCCGG